MSHHLQGRGHTVSAELQTTQLVMVVVIAAGAVVGTLWMAT